MTAAQDENAHVHRWVDGLSQTQLRHLKLISIEDPELPAISEPEPDSRPVGRRRLSFIGTLDAEPDLAEQSAELLRQGLGSTE